MVVEGWKQRRNGVIGRENKKIAIEKEAEVCDQSNEPKPKDKTKEQIR